MKGMVQQQQLVVERSEEGDKDKRKRRRSRKPKHNPAVSGCTSVDGLCGQTSSLENGGTSNCATSLVDLSSRNHEIDTHASEEQGPSRASDVAFSSLPTMHITGGAASGALGCMQNQHSFPSDVERLFLVQGSGSCPVPISYEIAKVSVNKEGYPGLMQRNLFLPHWSVEAVNDAIEKGDAFRAVFRVNAYNRLEAYCTLDGVPTDILISGFHAQNRAIEGDTVAIALDPVASWTRLRGLPGRNSSALPVGDSNEAVVDGCKGKDREDSECKYSTDGGYHYPENNSSEAFDLDTGIVHRNSNCLSNEHPLDPFKRSYASQQVGSSGALGKLCAMISALPLKRPTGRVLSIIEGSPRRSAVIGFLGVKQWLSCKEGYKQEIGGQSSKRFKNTILFSAREYIQLTPTDARYPKMMVSVTGLPVFIQDRLKKGDASVEMELVAARIDSWEEESSLPQAHVMHVFGRGGEIKPQIAAILFENAIYSAKFYPESLACLPDVPWVVPNKELQRRVDLRNLCAFTIDPSTASELDDALSVERVSDDIFRIGVHISDVSYFVLPDTYLDTEAQIRSTSVYLLHHKISMLPPLLAEDLGSLIPGVDRLTLSIIWDINLAGDILDRWIGHTVIRSCCKLSYEQAQDMIDGLLDAKTPITIGNRYPELHGQYEWRDVVSSVRVLHEISKRLKDNRFKDGALVLENSKLVFLFDEFGVPYDSLLCEQIDSNYLVEEYMLLANRTAADIISRAFPDCALLRRHPEPKLRKLKEFESFCSRHGFELDTSSSGQLQLSLRKIREKLKNDPVLYDILVSYASRPMQLAAYFCTGDLRDRENDWAHYALAVPLYTHFTSPLRRYPDIIVHRTLSAALEAEQMYMQKRMIMHGARKEDMAYASGNIIAGKCFTGLNFDKDAVESKEGMEILSFAALKHRVPGTEKLAEVAAHCNERKLASKHAQDAGEKLYLWAMLKKKEIFVSNARVLGLGPKFMSVYIHKLAMERRIYYDEVEGLIVEWLETTSTLLLDMRTNKRFQKRSSSWKFRTLEDVALVVNPCDLSSEQAVQDSTMEAEEIQDENDPAFFPLMLHVLSSVPVVLHAVGGDGSPLDIGARLYMSSYFR
eukprot:TRINITY_DN3011_c0_g1_i2.p1 TRINITY_DN3011_c0_g1~~TRINITY_DN3011_c0_g1_i2.p1  ORF type:complete len:1106 (-),score=254.73 TRINITY_DN3011_c0_g1_i2:667-3984(-)